MTNSEYKYHIWKASAGTSLSQIAQAILDGACVWNLCMCLNFILDGACASISDDTVNSAAPLLLLLQLLEKQRLQQPASLFSTMLKLAVLQCSAVLDCTDAVHCYIAVLHCT